MIKTKEELQQILAAVIKARADLRHDALETQNKDLEEYRLKLLEKKYDKLIEDINHYIETEEWTHMFKPFIDLELEKARDQIGEIKQYTLFKLKQKQEQEFYYFEAQEQLAAKEVVKQQEIEKAEKICEQEIEKASLKFYREATKLIKPYRDKVSESQWLRLDESTGFEGWMPLDEEEL